MTLFPFKGGNMKLSQKILLSGALLLAGSLAQAGLLLEPMLGYEVTKQTATFTAGEVPGAYTGMNYGLRLGYTAPVLFWAALDAQMGTNKFVTDASGIVPDGDGTRTSLGITAGVDLPILLRAWAGYGFSDQFELKTSAGKDTYKGTNTKVGVGFTMLPFVSVNVEYIMRKYTESSGDRGAFSTYLQKLEHNTVLLSLSLPLDL